MLLAMFRLLLSNRRYQGAHDGFLSSLTLISPQRKALQWHLHDTLHVPHLRFARSSLQTQTRHAALHAPYKFTPHCTLITTKLDERVAHIFVGASPHSAMPAYSALDVPAAKDTLESHALRQGRLRVGERIHLVKSMRYLLDAVVIRPSFQRRVRVMRDWSLG
jgi:hypothetical protein